MEKFKEKLELQLRIQAAKLLCAGGAISIGYGLAEASFPQSIHIQSFISGVQFGMMIGLFGVLFFYVVRNLRAIRNPERLRKLYISEIDERKQFIRQNSGTAAMEFIIYCFAVGAVVAGNINATVFFTLLGACFFVICVMGALKLYYKNKF